MNKSRCFLPALTIILAGVLFLIDLLVPLGVAVWIPYVGIVLLSLWFPAPWQTYVTAAVCVALITLGLFLSPAGGVPFWVAFTNRFLCVFALWVTAFVGLAA